MGSLSSWLKDGLILKRTWPPAQIDAQLPIKCRGMYAKLSNRGPSKFVASTRRGKWFPFYFHFLVHSKTCRISFWRKIFEDFSGRIYSIFLGPAKQFDNLENKDIETGDNSFVMTWVKWRNGWRPMSIMCAVFVIREMELFPILFS